MSYFLAPALVKLRDEINELFPDRDKASDGWIGDAGHAARPSDHNPCWACRGALYGVVRATDTDIDDGDAGRDLRRMILNATIGDERVWYVISNGIIYSSTYGFKALRYTGSNGHYAHVHVSLRHGVGELDTSRWFDPQRPKIRLAPVDLGFVKRQFLAALEGEPVAFSNGVGRIQQVLNRQYGEKLTVDGLAGKSTLDAWGRFEKSKHVPAVSGRFRIPDNKTLPILAEGRFRIAA